MYTQTACFEENGIIAHLDSNDGKIFQMNSTSMDTATCKASGYPVVGVYDAGISTIGTGDNEILCMPFSGYRRIGCGDVFLTTRKARAEGAWTSPVKILDQDEVSFHNKPDSPEFEWGLEGIKILELKPQLFAMIGVAFLSGNRPIGTRQRVFMAVADSLYGPYKTLGTLFDTEIGENGHPDIWLEEELIYIIYQARLGDKKPWYFRWSMFNKDEFVKKIEMHMQSGYEFQRTLA